MSVQASTSRDKVSAASRASVDEAPRVDPLQPLLAGAHARGMADAFELAGIAAVMIDQQGMVLHAGAPAHDLFGPELRIEYDHLVGGTAESTTAIQALIGGALGEGESPSPVVLNRNGRSPLKLHARRAPGAAGNVCQMLKVLIIIEESATRPAGN